LAADRRPPPRSGEEEEGAGKENAWLANAAALASAVGLAAAATTVATPLLPALASDVASPPPSSSSSPSDPRSVRITVDPSYLPTPRLLETELRSLTSDPPATIGRGVELYKWTSDHKNDFGLAYKRFRAGIKDAEIALTPAFEDARGPTGGKTLSSTLSGLKVPDSKVELPRDVKGAVRDALSGEVGATVNGAGVKVTLQSRPGTVTLRVDSPLLPKLPILSGDEDVPVLGKADLDRAPILEESRVAGATTVASAAPPSSAVEGGGAIEGGEIPAAAAGVAAVPPAEKEMSVWDRRFVYYDSLTNLQAAAAGVAAGVGASYAISYRYYLSQIEEADREAEEKRKAKAAKAKTATAAKKKKAAAASAATKKEKADGGDDDDEAPAAKGKEKKENKAQEAQAAAEPKPSVLGYDVAIKKAVASNLKAEVSRYERLAKRMEEFEGEEEEAEAGIEDEEEGNEGGNGKEEEEEKEDGKKRRRLRKILKKTLMPWRKYSEL